MLIWRLKSISEAGPFQRMSTPSSLPAAAAPAWTVCQKMCDWLLGTTAMTGLSFFLQEAASSNSTQRSPAQALFRRIVDLSREQYGISFAAVYRVVQTIRVRDLEVVTWSKLRPNARLSRDHRERL